MTAQLLPAPALAQEAGAAEADVIIVTAQRREEALEDVPMTVNVLSQDTLTAAGVNSVRDLANVTTGYQLGQGGSVPQPAVRGVTTLINGSYENNVAIYIDDIYQTIPAAVNIDLPNVASVQVLKGPQGTLFGRNATGGAILIDTIKPGDFWLGNAELTYARFDDKRASAYVAGPLSDTVGLSLAGYIRRSDGYFKKISRTVPDEYEGNAFGTRQDSVRAKLVTDLSDDLRATVGYAYTHSRDGRGVHFSPIENVPATYNLPGGRFPGLPDPNSSLILADELGETAFDFDPYVDVKQHEGFLKLELDSDIGKLRSITGYSETDTVTGYDFDGSYLPAFWGYSENKDKTFQQTIDFNVRASDNLNLLVGGQYFNIKTQIAPNQQFFGYVFQGAIPYPVPYDGTEIPLDTYLLASDGDLRRKKDAWAIFGDVTLDVTDRLSVTVGGRYSKETQDVSLTLLRNQQGQLVEVLTPEDSLAVPGTGARQSASFKKFTPKASVRYEITPRTSIYASYSKGFKSGEFNQVVPNDDPTLWAPVEQESIEAFEIGLKSAEGPIRFDLSAFYYDYTNLQVSTTTFNPATQGTVVLLQNAPSAEIYGVEGNFEVEVFDNFNVRGGATWLHARYGDNFQFSGTGVDPTRAASTVPSDDPLKNFANVAATQDLSGLQMARAPDFAAYLGADYLVPIGDGGIRFAVNAKYTDSYVVTNPSVWGGDTDITNGVINEEVLAGTPYEDRARQQRFREGSYVLVNASVTWTDPSDTFYVRVFGNNLTDHRYRLHYNGTTTFGTYSPMAEPLTYGVSLGFKFDGYRAAPPPVATAPPPPPPPPPPAPPKVVCNKGPYIVFFEWDQSAITPDAGTILDSAISAYGNCESVPIMLAGHADRSGSASYNVGLSQRRNASVRDYLTARGIPDATISSQGFGESQNRVPTTDGVRELQNRRVEITYGPGSGM